ncbi:hypothetical protein V6C03_04325 [Methyloligella sp. 2.7D]|uniref:hypothetical protein n=1 Tax=unclassified Methyloligella TaxID=2625955 RepID=UPI00157D1224|nr:hypothetical protein [Methyloligella sp. GL2]QKP76173.1 hypothetical protein HT051_01105 [Methyloligella sp. GL2]
MAKPSLVQAVQKLDKRYLKAPEVDGVDRSAQMEAGGQDVSAKTKPQDLAKGDVSVRVSYADTNDADGPATSSVVTVFDSGQQTAQLTVDPYETHFPFTVQIADVDPVNDTPEVVVSSYSGGAHCCGVIKVITKLKDSADWTIVDVGSFDGGPVPAKDYNGDGLYEFIARDPAFLYAFGCYACSTAPLMVLTVKDAKTETVSADPAFRKLQAGYLGGLVRAANSDNPNAYLAGYVAQKSLLGEGQAAWKLMLNYYDKSDDWGLQICPEPVKPGGDCPVKEITVTYPKALKRVLRENGYKLGK